VSQVHWLQNGCHRHHFSNFPDFSLIKITFPWPNEHKIADLEWFLASTYSPLLHSIIKTDHKFPSSLSKYISLRSRWPKMFLPTFNGIKSAVLNYLNFPWLFFKLSIFATQNKIPWLFPDLEEYFFPQPFPYLWQPC